MPASKLRVNRQPARKDWGQDVERLVLYLDIMGFTHRVTTYSHQKVKETLKSFEQEWQKRIKNLQVNDQLRFVQFSDSIILVANGVDYKMFNLITKAAVNLMQVSIKMEIPIKGVLAQGLFSFESNPELCFGKPLVDAYELHEEVYFYGIVVHHTAESTVKRFCNEDNPYCKNQIPIKKGKTSHYHLSWNMLKNLGPGNITDECNEWLDIIEEGVSGSPRIYVDNTRFVLNNDVKFWEKLNPEALRSE